MITKWLIAAVLLLPSLAVAEQDVVFTADVDGTEQRYVQVLPPDFESNQPVDVLIALHGHGSDRWQFVRQQRDECRAVRDVARDRAMILISPDYRATMSWMGPAAEADALQIIGRLRKEFPVRRVILCGGSMGGASCLTFAALHPDAVDGVVSMNGTANHVEYQKFQDAIRESFGGTKTEVSCEYRKRSAELWAHRFTMPTAFTVGGKDQIVPPESVLRLAAQLKRDNRPSLLIHRASGGHSTTYDDATAALRFVLDQSDAAADSPSPPAAAPQQTDLRLTLPDTFFAVVENRVSVYFDNIVLTQSPETFRFSIQCDVGQVEERRWTHVPAIGEEGSHTFSVTVTDIDGTELANASTTLQIVPAASGQDRDISLLIVGDSLTHATIYPNELARLLSQPGNPDWTMLGTHRPDRAAEGVQHEGYGGWTWQRFATMYEPNPDGTYRKRSSPFVFADPDGTPRLDVNQYFETSAEGQRPDVVLFALGINDCFGANPDDLGAIDERIDVMLVHAETLLAAFRSAAPNADLAVCVTTPPNARESSFEANYKGRYTRWGWKRIQHRLVERLQTHFGTEPQQEASQAGRIYVVPTHLDLDAVDGYPDNNGVHPNAVGYQLIGSSLYGWLKWWMSESADRFASDPGLAERLIGYTEGRNDLPGGQFVNWETSRACVIRADGIGRRVLGRDLITKPHSWTQFGGWLPDGTQAIVLSLWESPDNAAWERDHRTFRMTEGWLVDSCLLNLTSGRLENLTAIDRVSIYNTGLFLLPDGSGFGFTPLIDGVSKPFVMDRDGRNKRDVSGQSGGFAYGYSASPDGKRISYHEDYQIFISNLDGSDKRQIETGHPFNFVPTWSPDGEWLLFVSGEHYDCHPHIVRKDGTGLRKLADRGGYRGVVERLKHPDFHSESSDVPVWSMDGKSVYYTAQVGESIELMQVTLDGTARQISHSAAGVRHYHPSPSPDGQWILFGSDRSGTMQLHVCRADGTEIRQVTHVAPNSCAMHGHWHPHAALGEVEK